MKFAATPTGSESEQAGLWATAGHVPVLAREAIEGLKPRPGGLYLDGTFGGGGHCRMLLEACGPEGRVIALDRDPHAIADGRAGLGRRFGPRLILAHVPFSALAATLDGEGIGQVDGALLDLGVSSRQLDAPQRGFSFREEGPLDMRMDPTRSTVTAADLVNGLDQTALADLIFHLGEERFARRVARAIVAERARARLTTTRELAALLERVLGGKSGKIHPATRTFQALRIAVNGELDELRAALGDLLRRLRPGGRLAVISFHSLEDRIVKETLRAQARPPLPDHPLERGPDGTLRATQPPAPALALITRKPIIPGANEIRDNPRARSARLRLAERLDAPLIAAGLPSAAIARRSGGGA